MISGIPALGIRFDIEKLGEGSYGSAAWRVLWKAVKLSDFKPGTMFFDGDTRATLNGKENVFCIVIQTDQITLNNIKSKFEVSSGFSEVAAYPKFCQGAEVIGEPFPDSGYIEADGSMTATMYYATPPKPLEQNDMPKVVKEQAPQTAGPETFNARTQHTDIPKATKLRATRKKGGALALIMIGSIFTLIGLIDLLAYFTHISSARYPVIYAVLLTIGIGGIIWGVLIKRGSRSVPNNSLGRKQGFAEINQVVGEPSGNPKLNIACSSGNVKEVENLLMQEAAVNKKEEKEKQTENTANDLVKGMINEMNRDITNASDLLSKLSQRELWIKLTSDSFAAHSAVLGYAARHGNPDGLVLSVVAAFSPRSGLTELIAEGCDHKQYNLQEINKCALLYMSKDTLPYIKQNQSIWNRVKGVE